MGSGFKQSMHNIFSATNKASKKIFFANADTQCEVQSNFQDSQRLKKHQNSMVLDVDIYKNVDSFKPQNPIVQNQLIKDQKQVKIIEKQKQYNENQNKQITAKKQLFYQKNENLQKKYAEEFQILEQSDKADETLDINQLDPGETDQQLQMKTKKQDQDIFQALDNSHNKGTGINSSYEKFILNDDLKKIKSCNQLLNFNDARIAEQSPVLSQDILKQHFKNMREHFNIKLDSSSQQNTILINETLNNLKSTNKNSKVKLNLIEKFENNRSAKTLRGFQIQNAYKLKKEQFYLQKQTFLSEYMQEQFPNKGIFDIKFDDIQKLGIKELELEEKYQNDMKQQESFQEIQSQGNHSSAQKDQLNIQNQKQHQDENQGIQNQQNEQIQTRNVIFYKQIKSKQMELNIGQNNRNSKIKQSSESIGQQKLKNKSSKSQYENFQSFQNENQIKPKFSNKINQITDRFENKMNEINIMNDSPTFTDIGALSFPDNSRKQSGVNNKSLKNSVSASEEQTQHLQSTLQLMRDQEFHTMPQTKSQFQLQRKTIINKDSSRYLLSPKNNIQNNKSQSISVTQINQISSREDSVRFPSKHIYLEENNTMIKSKNCFIIEDNQKIENLNVKKNQRVQQLSPNSIKIKKILQNTYKVNNQLQSHKLNANNSQQSKIVNDQMIMQSVISMKNFNQNYVKFLNFQESCRKIQNIILHRLYRDQIILLNKDIKFDGKIAHNFKSYVHSYDDHFIELKRKEEMPPNEIIKDIQLKYKQQNLKRSLSEGIIEGILGNEDQINKIIDHVNIVIPNVDGKMMHHLRLKPSNILYQFFKNKQLLFKSFEKRLLEIKEKKQKKYLFNKNNQTQNENEKVNVQGNIEINQRKQNAQLGKSMIVKQIQRGYKISQLLKKNIQTIQVKNMDSQFQNKLSSHTVRREYDSTELYHLNDLKLHDNQYDNINLNVATSNQNIQVNTIIFQKNNQDLQNFDLNFGTQLFQDLNIAYINQDTKEIQNILDQIQNLLDNYNRQVSQEEQLGPKYLSEKSNSNKKTQMSKKKIKSKKSSPQKIEQQINKIFINNQFFKENDMILETERIQELRQSNYQANLQYKEMQMNGHVNESGQITQIYQNQENQSNQSLQSKNQVTYQSDQTKKNIISNKKSTFLTSISNSEKKLKTQNQDPKQLIKSAQMQKESPTKKMFIDSRSSSYNSKKIYSSKSEGKNHPKLNQNDRENKKKQLPQNQWIIKKQKLLKSSLQLSNPQNNAFSIRRPIIQLQLKSKFHKNKSSIFSPKFSQRNVMKGVPKCLQIASNQGILSEKELEKELKLYKKDNHQMVKDLDFKPLKNGLNSNISIKELNSKPQFQLIAYGKTLPIIQKDISSNIEKQIQTLYTNEDLKLNNDSEKSKEEQDHYSLNDFKYDLKSYPSCGNIPQKSYQCSNQKKQLTGQKIKSNIDDANNEIKSFQNQILCMFSQNNRTQKIKQMNQELFGKMECESSQNKINSTQINSSSQVSIKFNSKQNDTSKINSQPVQQIEILSQSSKTSFQKDIQINRKNLEKIQSNYFLRLSRENQLKHQELELFSNYNNKNIKAQKMNQKENKLRKSLKSEELQENCFLTIQPLKKTQNDQVDRLKQDDKIISKRILLNQKRLNLQKQINQDLNEVESKNINDFLGVSKMQAEHTKVKVPNLNLNSDLDQTKSLRINGLKNSERSIQKVGNINILINIQDSNILNSDTRRYIKNTIEFDQNQQKENFTSRNIKHIIENELIEQKQQTLLTNSPGLSSEEMIKQDQIVLQKFQRKYTNINDVQLEQNKSSVYSDDLAQAQLQDELSPFISQNKLSSIHFNQQPKSIKQNSLKNIYNHINQFIEKIEESPKNLQTLPNQSTKILRKIINQNTKNTLLLDDANLYTNNDVSNNLSYNQSLQASVSSQKFMLHPIPEQDIRNVNGQNQMQKFIIKKQEILQKIKENDQQKQNLKQNQFQDFQVISPQMNNRYNRKFKRRFEVQDALFLYQNQQ